MARSWGPQPWSIRAKSLALISGYVCALLAVYGFFSSSLLRSETANAEDRLRQTATLLAVEVDAYLEAGRQRLATVSRLPGMTYGLRSMPGSSTEGRIPPWTSLHYLFFRSPVFTGGVFLVDRDGKLLWSEPPGRSWPAESLQREQSIREVLESGNDAISAGRPAGALLDRPHVTMVFPVRNPDGGVDGVLGGIIDVSAPEFTKTLRAVLASDGRFVQLVDQHGRVLASNTDSETLTTSGEQGDGEIMRAAVPLTQAPWQIVSAQPRRLALAEVWSFQRMLLVFGALLLLSTIIIGAPIIRGFARDIGRLTLAAETMASGNLTDPVSIRRGDEIATLARSLDQMRSELLQSRAALERRLGEREEMIRLKDTFLANISHELRTPLNAIIGYNDMLADCPIGTDGHEFVSAVRRQAEHLHHLLSDLLTLSGLNIGKLGLEITPVQIATLMAHLQPMAERLSRASGVGLVWDCPAPLPTVETDPLRLEQVLTNLIGNAFKFTHEGRVVVRVRWNGERDEIRFEVNDTGIGIEEQAQARIFDEFWQADGAPTSARGGVGLGLALVKSLTTLLGGEVKVDSQIGRGSSFTVTLPVHFARE